MAEGARLLPAPLQQLAFDGILPEGLVNVAIFANPAREVLVQNLTNKSLYFSWDGLTNQFILPACSSYALDAASNKGTSNTASIPQGYGIWVVPLSSDTADQPTSGGVYVSYFYLS